MAPTGTVSLDPDGHTAEFTPATNYSGFASFYFNVTNSDTGVGFGPVTVSVMVSAVPINTVSVPSGIITLTNAVPYFASNAGGTNSIDYYQFIVSTNAVRAQFEINNPSGDMTLVTRDGLPLPDLSTYEYISANPSTNDELIVIFNTSSPVPLLPGSWFLSAVNVSGGPVTYSIKATEWPTTGLPIIVTGPQITTSSGTNSGFCITWASLPGVHYYVEGLTDLNSTNWITVSPTLTATDTNTTFCVPLPSPLHFFRVVEGLVLSTAPSPTITSITRMLSGVVLNWLASIGQQFQVQWTPSISPPAWNTFTNIITSTNGMFTFTDDGSQSGGLGGTRFYRLVQLP